MIVNHNENVFFVYVANHKELYEFHFKGGCFMKKRMVAMMLVLMMLLSTVACSSSEAKNGNQEATENSSTADSTSSEPTSEASSGEITIADELKVAMAVNPPTLDPWLSTAAAVRDTNRGIYEGLFELDENFDPKEQLCESYTVDETYQNWVFTLRKGVKFHNGKEMTADDVVASLNCWLENNIAVPSVVTAGEQFEKVDDYTVKLSLTKPALTLLNVMTSPCQFAAIMPKECVDARTETGVVEYIGTGPMKFVEWKQDSYISFERYEDYQSPGYELTGEAGDKTIYYNKVYFYLVTDSSIRTAGIQSGEYDIAQSISYDDVEMLKANSDINLVTNIVGNYAITLNKRIGAFTDEKVRQAAAYAINVDEIMAAMIPDENYVDKYASFMYKDGLWGTDSGSEYWNQQEVEKAKQLLSESSYDGTPIVMLSTTAYPRWIDASLIIKEQLEAVGFTVDFQTYDWATMLQIKKDPELFDCFVCWWPLATVPTALKIIQKDADGWLDFPEVTEAFEKMNSASSLEEAKSIWEETNEFLLQTASALTLGYGKEPYATTSEIKNYHPFIGMAIYGCYKE